MTTTVARRTSAPLLLRSILTLTAFRFVDDEAVEDNEEEVAQDDECADFIDDGEPTDVNDGCVRAPSRQLISHQTELTASPITVDWGQTPSRSTSIVRKTPPANTRCRSDTNATTMSSGLGDAGDTQVLGQTGPEHEEEVDESDGEHSAQ